MLITRAMPLAGIPALQEVSSQRQLVPRAQARLTGRQACLSQEQRPKSESGCEMYGSGEMGLVLSPKPDRRDIAALLQRHSQELREGGHPQAGEN